MVSKVFTSSRLWHQTQYLRARQQEHNNFIRKWKQNQSWYTRDLDIRYFFISDQIEKGYIKIQYCPIDQMTADYLTKPLQEQNFHKFCAKILNLPTTTNQQPSTPKPNKQFSNQTKMYVEAVKSVGQQECVGK